MVGGKLWVPDRRDMIWIDFNPPIGQEMQDQHPVLVLSPKAFNERTGIVIGLPMTHAGSNETNPFAVKVTTAKGEVAYVLTHQPKTFDWRQRGARSHPWKQLPAALFAAACESLNGIIAIA
ncbi:type II toxin-antitoxin system PemK/MazF family toxin [Rhodoferax antarcticus]|uniref:PemK-like family protein n=1 Tax=Rhodoferax antarcticus ANT.BR TaxID=1111071 RepID=A0A1Q8YAN9_9BURK|nr:type II toxin-antitoxin system PemK/MazF family toxin [Rhodoferax antarcticus]APW47147.1 growth inhibitor PemK [Rhodoferax antarcticus]APW48597.1 growth inhibitor PemK [Rhodoferax antarcticus]OLP05052.1 pemK-like family protein [Rhodoferax antarcticus ANT.BR]